jgi:cholesterol oxidase
VHQKLSDHRLDLQTSYGAIVIGSGYGGSICALRLAQAGTKVCLLERGKEWTVGNFPDTREEVFDELRSKQNPTGLFDYRRGKDLDVLVGNGLGGTSLINANVVIKPDLKVFQKERWPQKIKDDAVNGALKRYGDMCSQMLQLDAANPKDIWPAKVAAMQKSGQKVGDKFEPVPVAVNLRAYNNKPNPHGVNQKLCTLCGDCVTGCNVGAKNTLAMNYLPAAKSTKNVHIFTTAEVTCVTPAQGGYFVWVKFLETNEPPIAIFSPLVIVSAGALGSTGIMLRSAELGLRTSKHLGYYFSSNADQLGFGYNNDVQTNILGFGFRNDERSEIKVGPTILSGVHFQKSNVNKQILIEEGAIPRAFVDALRGFGAVLDMLGGKDTDSGFADKRRELMRVARDWAGYDPKGAANHSMMYLCMGHDGADGRLVLDEDGDARVLWEAIPRLPVFQQMGEDMYKLVESLGGTYLKNPRFTKLGGNNLITVHPLGGCPMGDDATSGAVDSYGEVFTGESKTSVHKGLFVVDGAILPDSVGVNPLYTISMLAERSAAKIVERLGKGDFSMPSQIPPPTLLPTPPLGLEFAEEMEGFISTKITNAKTPEEYEEAYKQGKKSKNPCDFHLTMLINNLSEFINTKEHEARVEGFFSSKLFGAFRAVELGTFNLFTSQGKDDEREMHYTLPFVGEDDRPYLLQGRKEIKDDRQIDLWSDNTRLFVDIYDTTKNTIVAQGMMYIGAIGFTKLLRAIQVKNSPDAVTSARAIALFGRFFLGTLWDLYVSPGLKQ